MTGPRDFVTLADKYADVETDRNGCKSYEFDDHSIVDFVSACMKASAAPDGWQPIESAKEVVGYLLWCKQRGLVFGFFFNGCWHRLTGEVPERLHPTHWMPLPEPPK